MSINRIQKLLFSEYCDFEEMVLVESPFAETTRDGNGLRQVHLGLTPSKLVLATDVLPIANYKNTKYRPGLDPEIETFELIAVYPIQCVNLSVFHRRKRQSIKARFCNNKILYFELGGFEKRKMFWNLWCEKVRYLNPEDPGSSHSETSVATSTTDSTLYLTASRRITNGGKNSQLWCKYAAGDFIRKDRPKWTDKHLYLGKILDENPLDYTPAQHHPTVDDFVKRVGPGEVDYPPEPLPNEQTETSWNERNVEFLELAEKAVASWEISNHRRARHRRRYAFGSQPHFFQGLGPWNVNPGERYSLQMKRAVSVVAIKRQPVEPELRLSVSRRQLIATISCDALYGNEKFVNNNHNTIRIPPKRPVIFFWTPEYWYRPRSARDAYQELQAHLNNIRRYHQRRDTLRGRFSVVMRAYACDSSSEYEETETDSAPGDGACRSRQKGKLRAYGKTARALSTGCSRTAGGCDRTGETSLQFLRRVLRMEVSLTAWDFDASTLAVQLTLIDKELFLKITPPELGVLVWQQSSKNAPNVGALIAFSHRISCLVVTEILKDDSEKIRARLVTRFINTAEKCNRISNFQSCRSVLCGLQAPPVYRLYSMWTYIRKRHSSKYEVFEKLCRLYRDPRLSNYQRNFELARRSPPYLPFIGDIIAHLLDKVPDYGNLLADSLGIKVAIRRAEPRDHKEEVPSLLRKILSSLKMWPSERSFAPPDRKHPCDCPHGMNPERKVGIERKIRVKPKIKLESKLRVEPNVKAKIRIEPSLKAKLRLEEKVRLEVKVKPGTKLSPEPNAGLGIEACDETVKEAKKTGTPPEGNSADSVRVDRTPRSLCDYYKPLDCFEDNRQRNLDEGVRLLELYQRAAANYMFARNELAIEYLLKARYREDKENFIQSFIVEPPNVQMN